LHGQWQAALNAYQESMAADPAQPEVRRHFFRCYLNLGMLDEAIGEAEYTSRRVVNGEFAYQSDLAEMWSLLRRFDLAIPEWRKLRLLMPEDQYYGFELAQALFNNGQADEALGVLKDMRETHPATRAYNELSEMCALLGRYDEAYSWAEQGLATNPATSLRRNYLENAEALGKWDPRTIAVADDYLAEDPGYAPIAMFKGNALLQAGQADRAFEVARSLLARNPEHLGAAILAKDAGVDSGRLKKALDVARDIAERRPWDVDRKREYAMLLSQDEKFSQAEGILLEQGKGKALSATAVLVYLRPTIYNYGGMNSASQIVSHVESLAGAGVHFVLPESLPQPAATQRCAMVVLVDADETVVNIVDAALQRNGACAVYAADSLTLSRRMPGKPAPSALKALTQTGRWRLAAAGPAPERAVINAQNVTGNPFTHGLMTNGIAEDVSAFSNRVHDAFVRLASQLPGDLPCVLVYPGGDCGQSSLDCLPDYLQTLRRVAADAFDYAIFYDDAGFYVPLATAERVPGRVVHAAWQGTNLLAHIYNKNPFTRIALDLAKSYYWQGQYERAIPWFETARQAGADPVEIDFNQGRALYLQDDIASAKKLLQRAHEQDPGSEKISTTLAEADDAWAGSGTAYASGWLDNEDRDYFQYGAEAETRMYRDHWRFGAIVGRNLWTETNATEQATRIGVKAMWDIEPEYRMNVNLWNLQMDNSELSDQWGGSASLHVPNRWLSGYLEGGFEAFEMETVSGLRGDIEAQVWRLESYAFLSGHYDWYVTITHQDNTDGNQIDMLETILAYRFKEVPYIGLGARMRLADSKFDAEEYWTPQSLQQYQFHASVQGTSGRYHFSVTGDAGYAREEQNSWRFVWGGRGVVETPIITQDLHLVAEAGYFEGPSYNRTSASLSLRKRF
ncbi:MAG: tetratricopeptide repeat protein, partial [bacterium]